MKIVFCHGLESGPVGRKSQALIERGYEVLAPDCRKQDLGTRVQQICDVIVGEPEPPLVVGSSFGGIAGLIAAILASDTLKTQGRAPLPGLVLCAPALQLPPPPGTVEVLRQPAPTIIVHGTHDEIIPIEYSRTFARDHGAQLVEVDDGHRLVDAGLVAILSAVEAFAGPPPAR